MAYHKWIGGGLGWAFGGPIGGIVGFAVGALFDGIRGTAVGPQATDRRQQAGPTTPGDLALTLVVLSAAVMKADGRVTQAELEHVRRFLRQQFGEKHAADMLLVLRDVLKRDIRIAEVCAQVRQHMPHPVRLQLMHYLLGIARADGRMDTGEVDILRRIAQGIGISDKDLASLDAMFGRTDTDAAYRILEVDPQADDDAVKRAYRRMAMKHHPDRVASLGEEVQRAAAEKFKKVQEAWEVVRRQRGLA